MSAVSQPPSSRPGARAARPSERAEPSDDVRLRILRGAARAFGDLGYGACSVESILSEASVSRRTFYKHFRSKDDVLCVLFENSVAMLLSAVRESGRERGRPKKRLQAAVDAYIHVHEKAGPLARVLLLEQFSPGSPLAKQRDAAMAAFSELITEAIVRDGRTAPDPILVHGVVAAINQITVQMATEHPDGNWDVQRAKRAMLRVFTALDDTVKLEV